jgi:CRP/FNR family transcriptional regulator, cyclic AMP receptor protein
MDAGTLDRVPLFASLSDEDKRELAAHMNETEVASGKHLVDQGDQSHNLFVIVDGAAEVYRDGRSVAELGPGDFFGEIALIERGPRTATCTAEAPTRLLVVNHRDFHSLMEEFPEIATQVLLTLAQRVRTLEPTTIN